MPNNKENIQDISLLNQKLNRLKAEERNIDSLGDFSKRIYFSSIPVVLLFTVFINLLSNTTFDLYNYITLNGITIPYVILMNTFICGTSRSRKRKLATIGNAITSLENEINELSLEQVKEKNNQNIEKHQYQIKPIDRSYELDNKKSFVKILNKK